MIDCRFFYKALLENEIDFFSGVPDSLLKGISACIADHAPAGRHIIAANEGNAVALAAGHHLATGKTGLVYLQNSGLGNAVNPLVSLADPLVYKIPVLLLIGWRGEPGVLDEPQHLKQGLITLPLLEALGINYTLLPDSDQEAFEALGRAAEHMRSTGEPYALVAGKGIFADYKREAAPASKQAEQPGSFAGEPAKRYALQREEALKSVLPALEPADLLVSTTGKLSREIYEYRAAAGQGHEKDFLNVGSMGHASQIALGIALNKPDRNVYCLDGDGAVLMHMGALAITGSSGAGNYKHLVFNNGAHDSVGGQPTLGYEIDLVGAAKACGYKLALRAESEEEISAELERLKAGEGPSFLEIRVRPGARSDLGRPKTTPQENKVHFMEFLSSPDRQ